MATTTTEIRRRFLDAVAGKDVRAVVECYAPDAVLTAPEGRFEGHDYIEAYYRAQFDAFADAGLTVHATHDHEDRGVAEWTFTGTQTGPVELPGGEVVPASGRRVTQRGADVALVEDDRIREHRLYYDQLELIEQLGITATAQG
jgi:steroid delta-isomerase-like uncharacterized protein